MKRLATNDAPITNASNAIVSHANWDLGRANDFVVGTAAFAGDVYKGDMKALAMADEKVAPYTTLLPDAKTIAPYAEKIWELTPIGAQEKNTNDLIDTALAQAPKDSNAAAFLGTEKTIISGVHQGGADFLAEN